MDEGAPVLGVGFSIDTQDSFAELLQLQGAMKSTEAKVASDAAKIERATGNMLNLGPATAQVTAFGAATSREMATAARETARAEKAGEGMVRQLQRQIETYGKTASEIRNMRAEQRALAAEQTGNMALAGEIRALNDEMIRLESGMGRVTNSANRNRAAMTGASYQIQDFITQVSMGANPINAFAVQGGQLAGQFSMIEGKAGNVARFFLSGWGLAITAGLMVLAPFVAKLFEAGDANDKLVDGLEENEKKTRATAAAQDAFARTVDGSIAKMRELTKATADQNRTLEENISLQKASIASALANVQTNIGSVSGQLAGAVADMKKYQSLLGSSFVSPEAQEAAAQQFEAARQNVIDLTAQLKALSRSGEDGARALRSVDFPLLTRSAKESVDQIAALNRKFDDQALKAQAAAAGNDALKAGLQGELIAIEHNRAAAIKAEEDKQKALKQTFDQIGRNITLLEGRRIAESVGGHVTSDHRDFDTQKQLYAKYMAYKAGTGPWAPLAAKPGTSFHELDQALDIAKTEGVNLKKLVAAFRAQGVKIVEALDEGDHYHVAWAKVGADAKAATEEARAAAKAATDYNKLMEKARFAFHDADVDLKYNTPTHLDVKSVLPDLPNWGAQSLDLLQQLASQAQVTAGVMADSFGQVGNVFGSMLANLAQYGVEHARISDEVKNGTKSEAAGAIQLAAIRSQAIGQTLAGMKGLFKQHSAGYAAMSAIEKAYAAFQAVQSAIAIARDIAHTVSSVANSTARTTANTAEGGSKMFAQLGVWAFPVVAAMIAVMAALGARGGGGGASGPAIPNVDDLQKTQGAGTVLGDAGAKSESIARSLDLMSKNSVQGINYTAEMVRSLRSIETNISRMAGNIARDVAVGNLWDKSALKLGTTATKGIFGMGGSSQLRELADQGIILSTGGPLNLSSHYKNQALWNQAMGQVTDGTVAQILKNGVYGASYTRTNETNTKGGIFGAGGGTSTGVDYDTGSLSSSITGAFTQVIGSIRDSIVSAAHIIGVQGASALIDAVKVHVGQISFEGMSGSEIEDQLSAVFSSIGDQMAGAVFPELKELQKVGEGLLETFMRVSKDYATIDAALSSIGMSFGAVGVASLAARENLIDLTGGLDEFVKQTDYFFNNFFSDADKRAFGQAQINSAFNTLHVAIPGTIEQFKALVEGLNLSTDAGQNMFAALMEIAPAFYDVQQAMKKAADEGQKLQIQLLQAQGRTAEATALQRQMALAEIDESNRALQLQVWAAQDAQEAAKAADELGKAWKSVGDSIMDEIKRIRGLADGTGAVSFASLLGQFNTATTAARAGDQDAAKSLPGLSQALLKVAADAATSRQELDRIQAQTAASLQATYSLITGFVGTSTPTSGTSLLDAAVASQASSGSANDNQTEALSARMDALLSEIEGLRADNNTGHATTAGNTGAIKRKLDDVTADSGGNAISTVIAA